MSQDQSTICELTITELLDFHEGEYIIPPYQRNYTWGETQLTQLIQDIIDYMPKKDEEEKPYYIGTLVVYERKVDGKVIFETIDGQQRLTTFTILSALIKANPSYNYDLSWYTKLNLKFDSRKKSTNTLKALFHNDKLNTQEYNAEILSVYNIASTLLPNKLKEAGVDNSSFFDYLYKWVKILRVPVPHDTNLNHYFEIMNNRGEQLEKHEVLKAKMLGCFNFLPDEGKKEKKLFNMIWEACSDMDRYVQYGFPYRRHDEKNPREVIFTKESWDSIQVSNFDEILNQAHLEVETLTSYSLNQILIGQVKQSDDETEREIPERFSSIITFPHFSLHVLRNMRGPLGEDVLLDDKKLIDEFYSVIDSYKNKEEKEEFVKSFAFQLLKSRYLFDRYIIKRETLSGKEDHWSLKKLVFHNHKSINYNRTFDDASVNQELITLLSMFHTVVPTMSYKYWLDASLNYLIQQKVIDGNDYISFLKKTAKQFVFDRFLAKVPNDYFPMIYSKPTHINKTWENIEEGKLMYGIISNNLIFNYIDYLLLKEEMLKTEPDPEITGFSFSARSSVEHYYPQHPMEGGVPELTSEEDIRSLNSIGNLCLISHSKNSRLSNFSPKQKAEFYSKNIDSIKQYKMMTDYEDWNVQSINKHHNEMIDLLKGQLVNED